jgi:hypothetical protein
MQINKLSQFSFGMPKISKSARELLPENLSEEDKKKLEQVEKTYPNAVLDVYPIYLNSHKSKKSILPKITRKLEKVLGTNPNFKITIHEFVSKTPDDKPIAGYSLNGEISVQDASSPSNFMYIHSTTNSFNEQLTPDDLVRATDVYDKRYKRTMDVAKRKARHTK